VSNITDYTGVNTLFDEYRPVGMKVYFSPTQSLTAMTGAITFGTMNVPTGSTLVGQTGATVKSWMQTSKTQLLAATNTKQCVLWSPEDDTESALQAVTLAALGNGGIPGGRDGQLIVVYIDSASPASAILGNLVVEMVLECTSNPTYDFLCRAQRHRSDPVARSNAINKHYDLGPFVGFD